MVVVGGLVNGESRTVVVIGRTKTPSVICICSTLDSVLLSNFIVEDEVGLYLVVVCADELMLLLLLLTLCVFGFTEVDGMTFDGVCGFNGTVSVVCGKCDIVF